MLEAADLSWAAGILEGEGSVAIRRQKVAGSDRVTYVLVVLVTMTDHDLVAEFARIIDGGNVLVHGKVREGHRQPYMCQVSARRAAAALTALVPYVRGVRMRGKIELALEFQAQKRMGSGRFVEGYTELQIEFFERMRELNVRGAANRIY